MARAYDKIDLDPQSLTLKGDWLLATDTIGLARRLQSSDITLDKDRTAFESHITETLKRIQDDGEDRHPHLKGIAEAAAAKSVFESFNQIAERVHTLEDPDALPDRATQRKALKRLRNRTSGFKKLR